MPNTSRERAACAHMGARYAARGMLPGKRKIAGRSEVQLYKGATPSLRKRLLKNIDVRGFFECWPWLGKVERNGYGRIRIGGRGSTYAPSHRVAYWLLVEEGEEYADDDPRYGLVVDHTCENIRCHNPAHLQLVKEHRNLWYRHHSRDEEYKEPYAPDDSDRADMERYLDELDAAI